MGRLEEIWDAAARKSAEVPGIKAAYATGAGGQGNTVRLMVEDFTDWPVVEVIYSGSKVSPGSWETLEHDFALRIWMSRSDLANAVFVLSPMLEKFMDVFRAGFTLYGTCKQAIITGSSGVADEQIDGKPYIYIDIELIASVERTATYAG